MSTEKSDQKCRHLGCKSECKYDFGLAPTNAELTVDEEYQAIYYCIASSCYSAQQSCSGYVAEKFPINRV